MPDKLAMNSLIKLFHQHKENHKKYGSSPIVLIIGMVLILFFLNNAFCLFYEAVPLGKMQREGVALIHKAFDVLIKHNYCENYGTCKSGQMFFDVTCADIKFDFYSSLDMDEKVKSEIIAEISKYSNYSIHISFYNESYETAFFLISSPTIEVFINRKKS